MAVIVVGVDHSEGAKAALRFALEEAKLRQATLRVVHAWQYGKEECEAHLAGGGIGHFVFLAPQGPIALPG